MRCFEGSDYPETLIHRYLDEKTYKLGPQSAREFSLTVPFKDDRALETTDRQLSKAFGRSFPEAHIRV